MNHWETHLYSFAVALTQGKKIKPENLQGMRDKAIKHGHTEEECVFVEGNAQLYIAKGVSNLDENRENVAVTAQFFYDCPASVSRDEQSELVHNDLIRLLDADSTTGVACCGATVQSISGDTQFTQKSRTHMVCAMCGSTDVRADAYAEWDADAGQWVLHSTYDEKHCENCEICTSLIEVDEATQIEIQAFGMVNFEEGSRLAENNETPDFYDVMVTTTPFDSGVILSLEEHDDMTAKEAAKTLAAMVAAYPTAAISSVNCDLGAV